MATIKKKHVKALGFTKNEVATADIRATGSPLNLKSTLYEKRTNEYTIEIVLTKDRPEEPEISIVIGDERVSFPGAYRLKDLQLVLYFLHGEDRYSEYFGGAFETRIIKQTPVPERMFTKDHLLLAFVDGQHTPVMSKGGISSHEWFEKKYPQG